MSSQEKQAAQAESDRLKGLPLPDLAAEVMPAFGPAGMNAGGGHQQGAVQVGKWLMASTSAKVKYTQPILGPTIEALGLLESAGLLQSRTFGSGNAKTFHATRAGEEALASGSVRELLAAPR